MSTCKYIDNMIVCKGIKIGVKKMETFNFYKKVIEEDAEMIRLAAFELIEEIDFTNKDTISESLKHKNEFESIINNSSIDAFSFTEKKDDLLLNCFLDLKNDEITVFDANLTQKQISLNYKTLLLKSKSNKDGRIVFDGKPKLKSTKLNDDVINYLNYDSELFYFSFIYDSHIDIDDTVRARSFNYVKEYNLLLDIKGTYKNGDLRIKGLNIFNINGRYDSVINTLMSLKNSENPTSIIQSFFDVTLSTCYVDSKLLHDLIISKGLSVINNEEFKELFELNSMR